MAISFSLPQDLEADLRQQVADLDQKAKEAFLVDLFRQEKMTHAQLTEALGLSRYATDGVLKEHGVFLDLTLDDVLADTTASRQARLK